MKFFYSCLPISLPVTNVLRITAVLIICSVYSQSVLSALPIESYNKSPRLLINSSNPDKDSLLLLDVDATVSIAGVTADVFVRRTYRCNTSAQNLQSVFLIPLPDNRYVRSAVATVGSHRLEAMAIDKKEARTLADDTKKRQQPMLIAIQNFSSFQLHLFNIKPGDTITIEYEYSETLPFFDNAFHFEMQGISNPYFLRNKDSETTAFDEMNDSSFVESGHDSQYSYSLNIALSAGAPLAELNSQTHDISTVHGDYFIEKIIPKTVSKDEKSKNFQLSYSYPSNEPNAAFFTFRSSKEQYFLLLLPPTNNAEAEGTDHEIIALFDSTTLSEQTSVSTIETLFSGLHSSLSSHNNFSAIVFGAGKELSRKSKKEYFDKKKSNMDVMDFLPKKSFYSTSFFDAIKLAMALPRKNKKTRRTIILVSSGEISMNEELMKFAAENLRNSSLLSIGIGNQVNERFFDAFSRATFSEKVLVSGVAKAEQTGKKIAAYLRSGGLRDISVRFGDIAIYDQEPLSYPDVLSGRPTLIFGKWRGTMRGEVEVSGLYGESRRSIVIATDRYVSLAENKTLRALWSQRKIANLVDLNIYERTNERAEEILRLGQQFSMETPYTGFAVTNNNENLQKLYAMALTAPPAVSQAEYSVENAAELQPTAVIEVEAACGYEPDADHEQEGFVTVKSVAASGGYSVEKLKTYLDAQTLDIQTCYNDALQKYRNLQGKFTVQCKADAKGGLSDVTMQYSEVNIPEVEECLLHSAGNIVLPPHPAQTSVSVAIEFLLEVL